MVLALGAVFLVGLHLAQSPQRVRRLIGLVTAVGVAVAVLAVAQVATGTSDIYWSIPTRVGAVMGGPFVNQNNFCLFMTKRGFASL